MRWAVPLHLHSLGPRTSVTRKISAEETQGLMNSQNVLSVSPGGNTTNAGHRNVVFSGHIFEAGDVLIVCQVIRVFV